MSLARVPGRRLHAALDVLFPTDCGHCGRPLDVPSRHGFCLYCWSTVRPLGPSPCDGCGLPAPGSAAPAGTPRARCARCPDPPLGLDGLRAAVAHEGAARAILLRAKFGRYPEILDDLAVRLLATVRSAGFDRASDVVVAVPAPALRRLARGFDAAERLAVRIAAAAALPLDRRALRRARPWAAAVKRLSPGARARAQAHAFGAVRRRVEGRAVLLVDDVVTTGATVRACGAALLAVGAREVRVACWARTLV